MTQVPSQKSNSNPPSSPNNQPSPPQTPAPTQPPLPTSPSPQSVKVPPNNNTTTTTTSSATPKKKRMAVNLGDTSSSPNSSAKKQNGTPTRNSRNTSWSSPNRTPTPSPTITPASPTQTPPPPSQSPASPGEWNSTYINETQKEKNQRKLAEYDKKITEEENEEREYIDPENNPDYINIKLGHSLIGAGTQAVINEVNRDVRKIYEECPVFLPEFSHLSNKRENLFLAVQHGTGKEIRDVLLTIKPINWTLSPSTDTSDLDLYYKVAVSFDYSEKKEIEDSKMIATLAIQFEIPEESISGLGYAKDKPLIFFYVSNKEEWIQVLSTNTQTIEIDSTEKGVKIPHALSFIKIPSLADTNDPSIKKLFYKLKNHINKCADNSKPLIKHLTDKHGLRIITGGTLRDQEKNNATSQGVLFMDVATSLFLLNEPPLKVFGNNSITCSLPKKNEKSLPN